MRTDAPYAGAASKLSAAETRARENGSDAKKIAMQPRWTKLGVLLIVPELAVADSDEAAGACLRAVGWQLQVHAKMSPHGHRLHEFACIEYLAEAVPVYTSNMVTC